MLFLISTVFRIKKHLSDLMNLIYGESPCIGFRIDLLLNKFVILKFPFLSKKYLNIMLIQIVKGDKLISGKYLS